MLSNVGSGGTDRPTVPEPGTRCAAGLVVPILSPGAPHPVLLPGTLLPGQATKCPMPCSLGSMEMDLPCPQ